MNIKRFGIELYWKLHEIYAPELRFSQDIYADFLDGLITPRTIWLDIGCGHKVLPEWRMAREQELVKRCRKVVGIDFDLVSLKHHSTFSHLTRGKITQLPFADSTFDLVTANMVVEHLDDPLRQFQEIRRVLKPEGRLLIQTPNVGGYPALLARLIPQVIKSKLVKLLENRSQTDVFPTYYRANTGARIKKLARQSGYEAASIKMIASAGVPMLALFPPLSILELLWIDLLLTRPFRSLRHDIIALLRRND